MENAMSTTDQKRVALYARVSTAKKDESGEFIQDPEVQLQALREYARQQGWTVSSEYVDRASGAKEKRPALDRLMADARIKKFDVVLVWKFDRFARSLKMLVDSLALFQELGIDFISYKENIDTTTSMGRLIFHINSAYAEFEREIIRDRVMAGIKAKREKTGTWGRRKIDTAIQTKINELIQAGISIRKVAQNLQLSTRTVQKYINNV